MQPIETQELKRCICGATEIPVVDHDNALLLNIRNPAKKDDEGVWICPKCLSFSMNGAEFKFDNFEDYNGVGYRYGDMQTISFSKNIYTKIELTEYNITLQIAITMNSQPHTLMLESTLSTFYPLPNLRDWIWDTYNALLMVKNRICKTRKQR